ncbi:MAG TPA: FtsX-like permease family protein, partial [Actinomycetota bacterium]|nr:FtsX-like permease family protein [Actinomycetota bacterium]
MGAIRLRLGAELRARWRGWLGLALLLAAFAGLTFATAAGARRTDTAYQRLLKISHPFDQFLLGVGPHPVSLFPLNKPMTLEQVRSLPEVADLLTEYFFDGPNGTPGGIASPDTRMDRSFNTARIVAGRLPESATEVAVPVAVVSTLHARVGGTITVRLVDQSTATPKIVPTEFTVTGIIAVPGEFPPYSDLGPPRVHFSAAFYEKYQSFGAFPYTFVRLKRGPADMPAFLRSLGAISHGFPVIGYRQEDLARNVERSFHLQAVALELFALFLAIVAALVLGQTLGRQAMAEGVDYPALRALGMTRRELFGLGVIRASILSVAGIALAIPIAIALSPIAPTGLARAADPNPGVHFDLVALGGGAILALVVLMLLVLIPCVRAARLAERDEVFGRAESGAERTSRSVEALTRAGASAPAVVGMRLALEPGRGRTAVPVRTTIAGVVLAIAALTITLSFGASLRYLLDTPRLYGQTWDEGVGWDNVSPKQFAQAIAAARADPNVESAAPLSAGIPFLIDGVPADGMVVPPEAETFLPPIESGRGPRTADEIALGPKTLRRIHKNVGDEVSVSVVGVPARSFRVV